ncbi:hypothetical protein LCGC14_0162050 [marine sediment metagenome]|uniref:4Fe-4S ferredoxin-type domain-containing protein n=1 Tax=marine sediment metagenome TaxID=412755 RepID=A0A0F9UV89_9ZZZZ|nr:4Fe-4S dicluster domain-containing protein [Phycisphaerae bacterium]HDZ43716.1 4Fe-4S dicluster domain-containing protein [Phycisphaerae bacterium]
MMESATHKPVDERVLINLDRCIECGSCAAACHYSHTNMPSVDAARTGWALLPVICRQCKAASCVDTCPAEAMICDDDGVVRRRLFRCIGCGSCAKACPFGVIPTQLGGVPTGFRSNERMSGHQIAKCDLCFDRTAPEAPTRGVPRCVAACPSGALTYADEHRAKELGIETIGGRTTADNPYKRR